MIWRQQQVVSSVDLRCQCHTGSVFRDMHLRTEKEDLRLQTMDAAIAASFYARPVPGQKPPLKTSFGIMQEIVSVRIAYSATPQFFLKIKWCKQSLAAEDPRIRGVTLIKSSSDVIDFEYQNVDAILWACIDTVAAPTPANQAAKKCCDCCQQLARTPAGFAKAAKDMDTLWTAVELPTEASLQQTSHANIVKETELQKRDAHLWHSHRIWCVQRGSYCSTATQGAPDGTGHAEHYQPR